MLTTSQSTSPEMHTVMTELQNAFSAANGETVSEPASVTNVTTDEGDYEKTAQELYDAVVADVQDRKDWYDRVDKNRLLRLNQNKRSAQPYPGAPDLREPLIDDNVTQLTAVETQLLWNTRAVATFLPHSQEGFAVKAAVEDAFDGMVKRTLSCRAKFENLLDLKNERGFSVAKLTVNDTAIPGQEIPDFEAVDQRDVIVPTATRRCRDADRICHAVRYSIREFRDAGRKYGWANIEETIKKASKSQTENGGTSVGSDNDRTPAERATLNGQQLSSSPDEIVVWEVYHYRDEMQSDGTKKHRKWVCVFAPECPELVLKQFPWRWEPTGFRIVAPDGSEIAAIREGEDRPWPFVQFRFSNRNLAWYDVLGVADKLRQDQDFATANITAKAVMMDYCCKPFLKGGAKLQTFKWRPGDSLPDGADFAIPPRVDPVFDYNADLARANAARRVGSPYGALSSTQSTSKSAKSATEVSTTAQAQSLFSADSVERLAEPLAELFTMMWEWLRHKQPELLVMNETQTQPMPEVAYQYDFTVVAGVSGKSANPDFLLRQMETLGQFLSMYPAMAQFLRGDQMAKFIVDLLDPKLTPLMVVQPGAPGAMGTAPIEQQVAMQGQGMQQMATDVTAMKQYMLAMAQQDAGIEGGEPNRG